MHKTNFIRHAHISEAQEREGKTSKINFVSELDKFTEGVLLQISCICQQYLCPADGSRCAVTTYVPNGNRDYLLFLSTCSLLHF